MSQQQEASSAASSTATIVEEKITNNNKASSSSAPEQQQREVPKLKSQVNKQKLQKAIKEHLPPNHTLWREVFSFLESDDLFFGVGCVCKCWKSSYLDGMTRNLLIMFNRNLQTYCENNQINESSREQLARRTFIEMWKEYIELLIINDLSQIIRLDTRKLLLLNYNTSANDHHSEESRLFEKFANELCDKERMLPITTKKEYTTMSMELRNILVGKGANNNVIPTIDNSITIKPVTSSTSSYSISIDENPNEEKTGLLNSYKKIRISNFDIQNKTMIELLENQWKQYFSRFVWNHQRPSMLQKTDLTSGEVVLDSEQGEKSVGIIQTILNMFGCNFENDLSASNESFSSSLSLGDGNVNVLNISLFINGEFGSFIADGYSEVGFDFMERTFKIGKQVYQCKLNLCGKFQSLKPLIYN